MLHWVRPSRCDNSGPNCPEVAIDETTGDVYIRSSRRPDEMARLASAEWADLREAIEVGEF